MSDAASLRDEFNLLPWPRECERQAGTFELPRPAAVEIGAAAAALRRILPEEWQREFGAAPEIRPGTAAGFYFRLGPDAPESAPPAGAWPESYTLALAPGGIAARSADAGGLLYAWQTLKQILRAGTARVPCLRIRDWPDLRWRTYHLDCKGTRRSLENLHAILPQLAELKVNAVLAEYEDYLRLDRHPDLAVPGALSKDQLRAWIAAAREYNITVIPLVQTLGHLHYALRLPAYSRLQEKLGDPAEACPSHPDTWPLVRDWLDEIMELHAGQPLFHLGMDEAFNLGTCPRCQAALAGRPKSALFAGWLNRCCGHLRARGFKPLVWGDMVVKHFDRATVRELDQEAVYIDGAYVPTGPLTPCLPILGGHIASRGWLRRPSGPLDLLPAIGFRPGRRFFEDLSAAEQDQARALAGNPEFPRYFRADANLAQLAGLGLRTGFVSGIRVSFHGCVAPRFITGQLNTLLGADICRRHGSEILIGSSWSRGHSLAGMNAHPELDWYGIAALGAGGWSPAAAADLPAFDRAFAAQHFGLPEARLGDLHFQFERSSQRVDHVMDNYLPLVEAECARLAPLARRHADQLELLLMAARVQQARYRAQFAQLELEYFDQIWERVSPDFKARIGCDIQSTLAALDALEPEAAALYARTILAADAAELAATQLAFFREQLRLVAARRFPVAAPGGVPAN